MLSRKRSGYEGEEDRKRYKATDIIPNAFNIVREEGFVMMYYHLMKFNFLGIAGGYPSSMYYNQELYEGSDLDVFCLGVDAKTFVLTLVPHFDITYEIIHD